MYEHLYKNLIENNADVCICDFYISTKGKNIIRNNQDEDKKYNKEKILKEILLDKNIQSYAWNKLYKKELFNNIRYPFGKKYEDIGTTFYLLEKCNNIFVTKEPKYYYVMRDDSIVNNNSENTIKDYIEIIDSRYDYISKKYEELKPYNIYYLTKTLITAYTDMYKLKDIKEETYLRILKLKEKVKKIYIENEEKIIKLFDEKQKIELYTIFYDEKLFKKLISE